MEPEKNKNLSVFLIGLTLIATVVGISFFKSYLENKKNISKNIAEEKTATDEVKKANSITSQELLNKIAKREKMVLIDIRSIADFKQEHLGSSKNIPLENFQSSLGSLDKNDTYILIDTENSPEVIDLVSTIMPKNGFTEVSYLNGGFTEWKNNFFLTVSDGDPTSIIDQAKVKYVSSDDLNKAMGINPYIIIIDVRTKAAYDIEHLKNSINIYVDDIEKKYNVLPLTGAPIVLYDDDNISAFKAAVRLFNLGRVNFLVLSDGFKTWKEKSYPTEKTQP